MTERVEGTTRRQLLRSGVGAVLAFSASFAAHSETPAALRISNRYSPFNKRRPRRPFTYYIVLHTTEGAEGGSLDKVWRMGEAHYFVRNDGRVLRIIDRTKIATHAGRSMWEGNRNIDNYSIGIEVVGHHDQEVRAAQYEALRELLRQLKDIYTIADDKVLTHSMVAYGRPNRFHPNDHRGRKRCGMIFARPDVRLKLGLATKPDHDADVQAGRLVVADAPLYRFLFAGAAPAAAVATPAPAASAPAPGPAASAAAPVAAPAESNIVTRETTPWFIARERYDGADTTYVFPDGKRLRGDQIQDWGRIPEGTRVLVGEGDSEQTMEGFLEIGKDGDNAAALAGEAVDRDTTIYFLPSGMIRTGREIKNDGGARFLEKLPAGTRVLIGYVYGGYVKTRRPPSSIAGIKWNYPSTFYRFPDGRIVSGDEINDSAIPPRTLIFYQN